MAERDIVLIDREKCTGCGACVTGCHEGALQIVDGKAVLVSELVCDGLGACIGTCPVGAITVERRPAQPYSEVAALQGMLDKGANTVRAHLQHLRDHNQSAYVQQALDYLREHKAELPFDPAELLAAFSAQQSPQPSAAATTTPQPGGGCPGSMQRSFAPLQQATLPCGCAGATESGFAPRQSCHSDCHQQQPTSELSHFPVQLRLINPAAPHFHGSNLLLAADCTAFAVGDFHSRFLRGKTLAVACPKLDGGAALEQYVQKITALIDIAEVDTITVLRMEVPCCGGLVQVAQAGRDAAQRHVPIKVVVISVRGEVLGTKWI